jgi:hypothetical protein
MDRHTLAVFGGIIVSLLIIVAVISLIPGYGGILKDGVYDTGDKLLDKAEIITFEMKVEDSEHGIIEFENMDKNQNNNYITVAGEKIQFNVTPKNGYQYARLVVRYGSESFTLYPSDGCSFVAPESDITVQVFFEPISG